MIKPAEEMVALFADCANARQDTGKRHAHQQQGMGGEHQASLQHFRHDFGGARIEQPIELGIVEGAHDHR